MRSVGRGHAAIVPDRKGHRTDNSSLNTVRPVSESSGYGSSVFYRASEADRVLAGIPPEDVDQLIRAQAAAQRRPGGEARHAFMEYSDHLARHRDLAADQVERERHPNRHQLRISRSGVRSLVVMLAVDLVAMYFTYKSPSPYLHSNFNEIKLIEDGGLLFGGICLAEAALESKRRGVTDRFHTRRLRAFTVQREESAKDLDRILRTPELAVELRQSGHFIGDDLDLRAATTAFCDRHTRALTAKSNPIRASIGPRPETSAAADQESQLWQRDRWDDGATLLVASARLGLLHSEAMRVVVQGVAKDLNREPRNPRARAQAFRLAR